MLYMLFLQVLNMSFTASLVIIFVLISRLFLKKAPKIFSYVLWFVVLFRLISPFSFESVFSFLPEKTSQLPSDIMLEQIPNMNTGLSLFNNYSYVDAPAATVVDPRNPLQWFVFAGICIWILGILGLFLHSMISILRLKKRLNDAALELDNIYISRNIGSPFVMGVFKPRIYLPANLTDTQKQYIILHEETHIKRLDHVVKIISFFVLCLHWFNPLVWVAFYVSSQDMEMSCDERVIKILGNKVKKDYSSSLLTLATGKKIVGSTPLAFGEGDTKIRIINVLNYKRPAFWVMVVCVIAALVIGVGLLADPVKEQSPTVRLSANNKTKQMEGIIDSYYEKQDSKAFQIIKSGMLKKMLDQWTDDTIINPQWNYDSFTKYQILDENMGSISEEDLYYCIFTADNGKYYEMILDYDYGDYGGGLGKVRYNEIPYPYDLQSNWDQIIMKLKETDIDLSTAAAHRVEIVDTNTNSGRQAIFFTDAKGNQMLYHFEEL